MPEIIHQDGGAHRILDGEAEIMRSELGTLFRASAAGCHGECFDFWLKKLILWTSNGRFFHGACVRSLSFVALRLQNLSMAAATLGV